FWSTIQLCLRPFQERANGDPRRRRRLLPIAYYGSVFHLVHSGEGSDQQSFGLGRQTPDADLSDLALWPAARERCASGLLLLPAIGRAGTVECPLDRYYSGIGLYEFAWLDARYERQPVVGEVGRGHGKWIQHPGRLRR